MVFFLGGGMGISDGMLADLVREVCHDGGAGPLLLGGAMAGFRSFDAAVGEGVAFPYVIMSLVDPAQWEAGTGVLDGAGRLVRVPVASSAGGAAVDFSVGEKSVALTVHAAWLEAVNLHGHGIGDIAGLGDALAGRQAASGELDAVAAVSGTAFGRALLGQADGAAVRGHVGALGASGVRRMRGAELHINTQSDEHYALEGTIGKVSVQTQAMSIFMDGGQASFRVLSFGSLANNRLYRANGTFAARSDVVTNDVIGDYNVWGMIGGTFAELSRIRTTLTAAAPGPTNLASRMSFHVGRNGSASMQETLRLEHQALTAFGSVAPSNDNGFALGSAAARWSVIHAASGAINTSDARVKDDVAAVGDDLLDAWGAVNWRQFRFADAVAAKGAGARWHIGLVAQQVRDVIDARLGAGAAVRFGLLCHDVWDEGDRWGLRYEECLALEAAWQRRRIERVEARLALLEAQNDAG